MQDMEQQLRVLTRIEMGSALQGWPLRPTHTVVCGATPASLLGGEPAASERPL
jgi:hypothetical protein